MIQKQFRYKISQTKKLISFYINTIYVNSPSRLREFISSHGLILLVQRDQHDNWYVANIFRF